MTKTWHKKTAVASMFQNGISRNTKCAERDGFRREGHICIQISRYVNSIVFTVNISSIEISLTRVWPVLKLSLGCHKTRAGYTPMDTYKQW